MADCVESAGILNEWNLPMFDRWFLLSQWGNKGRELPHGDSQHYRI